MTPIPVELRAQYRHRGARDHLRLLQRWYGTPFSEVEPWVPRVGTVVDVGCGFGLFAAILALASPERSVVGLDLDAQKIARGNAIFAGVPTMRLAVGTAEDALPPCDAVVFYDVLHHLRDTTIERALSAAYAALRPGGRIIVKENDTAPRWKRAVAEVQETVAVFGGITKSDPWKFRDRDGWSGALAAAGFRVQRADAIGCHSYGGLLPHSLFLGEK